MLSWQMGCGLGLEELCCLCLMALLLLLLLWIKQQQLLVGSGSSSSSGMVWARFLGLQRMLYLAAVTLHSKVQRSQLLQPGHCYKMLLLLLLPGMLLLLLFQQAAAIMAMVTNLLLLLLLLLKGHCSYQHSSRTYRCIMFSMKLSLYLV